MIAIIGTPKDNVLSIFAGFLSSKSESFLFINLNELANTIWLHDDHLVINSKTIPYEKITGYYCRFSGFEDDVEDKLTIEFHQQAERLSYFCNYEFKNVINRPCCDGSNNSKPYQLLKVLEHNLFKIPESNILANTNCPDFKQDMIYKSTSGMRSIVTTVESKNLATEISCPVLFQERIHGDNIRVHVLGEQTFALKIKTYGVDYRYVTYQPSFETIELPLNIRTNCIAASKLFDLKFSGVDLIQVEDDYFFLEANPTPGYVYFEEYMHDRPISNALLSALKSEEAIK